MTKRYLFHALFYVAALLLIFVVLKKVSPTGREWRSREGTDPGGEVEQLVSQAMEFYENGEADQALSLVDQALERRRYNNYRPRLFTLKIDLMLWRNEGEAARTLVEQAWRNDPECARAVFGKIYDYLRGGNDPAVALDWLNFLREQDHALDDDQLRQMALWQLEGVVELSDEPRISANIKELLKRWDPEAAASHLEYLLGRMLYKKQDLMVQRLLGQIQDMPDKPEAIRNLLATLNLRCALSDGDQNNILAAFKTCVEQLPDEQLEPAVRSAVSTLQKNNLAPLAEQCVKYAIFNGVGKNNTVNYSARVWVESGFAFNRKSLIDRLDSLLNARVPSVIVGNLFDDYFYQIVDDKEMTAVLCTVGERILADCTDTNINNIVKIKLLDGAFLTEDFDKALQILESGITVREQEWHDLSIAKVKAHRALAQNKPRDAVQHFREFMNALNASGQQEDFDPTTGIAYSREWILGRNAKRIADILDTIPDRDMAEKARVEARAYFKIALQKAANYADALKLLQTEVKELGM